MFALQRAFKFQQPIFAFSQFQLLRGKYVVPPKPRKQKQTDLATHQKQLKEWIDNYEIPKQPSIASEKIVFYGNQFPHLRTKWSELFQHVKTLTVEQQAKDEEIIKQSIEQKKQIYQKRMQEYQNKYLVSLGNVKPQGKYFQANPTSDFKQAWIKYNQLSEEEKKKYEQLAQEENQKKKERLEKFATQFGMSLEEFKSQIQKQLKENRLNKKKESSSSSSSDDEKKVQEKKKQQK